MIHSKYRFARLLILGWIALVGCDSTVPATRGSKVRIYQSGVPYDEQTIEVGATVQLTARVLDAAGDPVEGDPVEWSSDAPGVAAVDGTGIVSGIGVGTARIVARNRVGSDTALINVAQPLAGTPSCASGAGISLGVGETRVIEGAGAASICLPGSSGGSEFELTVVNTGSTAAAALLTRVEGSGTSNVGGGPNPSIVPATGAAGLVRGEGFHHHMRHEVSAALEPRLRAGVGPMLATAAAALAVGEVVTYNVETTSGNGCTSPDPRGGRVRAMTDRAIVVADTLNPSGGFSDAEYLEFGRFFDSDVWPLVTGTFGTPSDIDQNQKVVIFFTRGVNERPENSPAAQGIYVGGFFFNRDLFPKTGTSACAGSNVTEMFYMLVPDPQGTVRGRTFRKDFVARSTRNVLVHEFQHLVNDSRRLHVNKAPTWEETWLNEGLSHIAEELMFYRASGFGPRQNLGRSAFQAAVARDHFETFQLDNISRLASFLREPATNSPMGSDILATRGAAWHFLRYAADRKGDEAAFWRAMVTDSKTGGLANLRAAIGVDPKLWIRDWAAAVYLDDTGLSSDPAYRFPSWNLRDVYPGLRAYWTAVYETYPLYVERILNSPSSRTYGIKGGGAAYVRAGAASGATAALRVTVGGLPAPSRLKVVVTRVK